MTVTELDPDALYHLASNDEWAEYQRRGVIDAPSLATEGFIHCSWGRQVPGTVEKHFAGRTDILALELDQERIESELREEDSYASGQAFPHVYGTIPVAAVIATTEVAGSGDR